MTLRLLVLTTGCSFKMGNLGGWKPGLSVGWGP